ncbi:hypothetical protein K402DRAFT_50036 [Aulographum hederae CBS 113979]|uniref:Uncharacterized protein n=1 Tax=Aulographum hederae CBS 113979 TaxID=1176131 RepID=A0A6G1H2T7_9PEZI|nr:hypothetical protein K402DRAFT_50036 [Aulographum hederae CBS 113979]
MSRNLLWCRGREKGKGGGELGMTEADDPTKVDPAATIYPLGYIGPSTDGTCGIGYTCIGSGFGDCCRSVALPFLSITPSPFPASPTTAATTTTSTTLQTIPKNNQPHPPIQRLLLLRLRPLLLHKHPMRLGRLHPQLEPKLRTHAHNLVPTAPHNLRPDPHHAAVLRLHPLLHRQGELLGRGE